MYLHAYKFVDRKCIMCIYNGCVMNDVKVVDTVIIDSRLSKLV